MEVPLLLVHPHPLAGEPRRGRSEIRERRRPEALEHRRNTRRGPGDAAGSGSDVEDLRCAVEEDLDRHELRATLDARAARHLDEEVAEDVVACGVDQHEAAGAEAREGALGRKRGEHGGDRGIDGVAAVAQHARPRFGRQRVPGGDCGVRRHDAEARRPKRGEIRSLRLLVGDGLPKGLNPPSGRWRRSSGSRR